VEAFQFLLLTQQLLALGLLVVVKLSAAVQLAHALFFAGMESPVVRARVEEIKS
jgi:hypothetical protein